MNAITLSDAGYLLLVIPGFIIVWTVRHFADKHEISGFEYAAWSFIWGTFLFLTVIFTGYERNIPFPAIPLNDPSAVLGTVLGSSLVLSTLGAPVLGFVVAGFIRAGLFQVIDRGLNWVLEKFASLGR